MRNSLGRLARRSLALPIILLSLLCANAEASQIFYLGVGNEEFKADVMSAYQTMVKYSVAPASIAQQFDLTGPQIVNLLNAYRNALTNGDVLIFHYSGHGGGPGIPDAAPVDENNAGNNGDEGVIGLSDVGAPGTFTPGNVGTRSSRDDAIANELNNFAPSVAVLSIFDSCFAGEMIDGTSDISRGLVIGTTDANNCAQGNSLFMPYFNDAFSIVNGTFKSDTNGDGLMTVGELYTSLSAINGVVNTSGGTAFARNFNEPAAHLQYVVAAVPEASTFVLLVAGLVVFPVLPWRRLRSQLNS
jgi:hypothetical protein